jgi:hypothetical protein
LSRDPNDLEALTRTIILEAKSPDSVLGQALRGQAGCRLLYCAFEHRSQILWESLWNEKHPDRIGQAWDESDFELSLMWKQRIRAMFTQCGQGAVLTLTGGEFVTRLSDAGGKEELINALAPWFQEIRMCPEENQNGNGQ